jgi:hypothetical protein
MSIPGANFFRSSSGTALSRNTANPADEVAIYPKGRPGRKRFFDFFLHAGSPRHSPQFPGAGAPHPRRRAGHPSVPLDAEPGHVPNPRAERRRRIDPEPPVQPSVRAGVDARMAPPIAGESRAEHGRRVPPPRAPSVVQVMSRFGSRDGAGLAAGQNQGCAWMGALGMVVDRP